MSSGRESTGGCQVARPAAGGTRSAQLWSGVEWSGDLKPKA